MASAVFLDLLWPVLLLLGLERVRVDPGNTAFTPFDFESPPPPDPGPVAWVGLAGFLLPAWTWWIDRHRDSRKVS